jgi:hypothetical protein
LESAAHGHRQPYGRPARAQQNGGAAQHDGGGDQAEEKHVVQHVHRAGAAQDLPHHGAGKAFRVPGCGEILHAGKPLGLYFGHHVQREAHHAHQADLAQHHDQRAQHAKPNQRRQCVLPRAWGVQRHGIHQAAGVDRRCHVGQRGAGHGDDNHGQHGFLPGPMGK